MPNFVVYSEDTGRVRRIFVDAHPRAVTVGPGEASRVVPDYEWGDLHALQAYILRETGKQLKEDRYVVINDKDEIVGAVHCDPLCGDSIHGHTLMKHSRADKTWKYEKQGKFTEPAEPTVTQADRDRFAAAQRGER